MRSLATLVYRRCLLLGLLAGSLGACQRASYQFQPASNIAQQAVSPVSALESAVVAIGAAPPAAQPLKSGRMTQRHLPRRTGRSQMARVLAMPTPTQPVANARVAAPVPRLRQEPGPVVKPVRYRSRGVAILLAALAITYLPLSLHNFYLGYYGRGAAAITLAMIGIFLFALGAIGGLFSSAGLTGLGVVGLAILAGWFIWQITDFIRIITRDLKPKSGEYNARLFQLKSDAGDTTSPLRPN